MSRRFWRNPAGLFLSVLASLLFAPAVSVGAGDLLEQIKKKGELVVAQGAVEQPPFFWKQKISGKEEWIGFEVDLAKLIADRLGVTLRILRLGEDYNEVVEAVSKGKAHIGISNLSDTPERRKLVDFATPYIVSRVAMLIDLEALDKDGIDAIEPADLNRPQVRAALTKESVYDFVFDEIMPLATRVDTRIGTFDDVISAVVAGKAHLVIDDGFTLFLGMDSNPELGRRYHLHIFDEYDDPLSMCLPQGQPELREFLNRIIDEIEEKEPVTLELIVKRYMR